MNSLCPTCRKMLYRTDACKGDGVECGRTDGGSKKSAGQLGVRANDVGVTTAPVQVAASQDKSTAARKDVLELTTTGLGKAVPRGKRVSPTIGAKPAGTQAPPVDTPKPKYKDRHKPGYQAQKQREYRARKRNAKLA